MNKLWFLGTGSAVPSPGRANLTLLVGDISSEQLILVDCSGTPVQSIFKAGCLPEKLTDVILTHDHTDHIYALPSLIHSLWMYAPFDNSKGLRVHGLSETLEVARKLVTAFNLENKRNAVRIDWKHIDPRNDQSVTEINSLQLFPFPVTHGKVPAIGLDFVGASGENIVYTCDAQADHLVATRISDQTRILIHDCGAKFEKNTGHAGAREIATLVRGRNLSKVYLVHLPLVSAVEIDQMIAIVKTDFPGEVLVPSDFDAIELCD